MKYIMIILCTTLPFICSAGGGGELRPETTLTSSKPEIVYHMGEQDGLFDLLMGHWLIISGRFRKFLVGLII